MSDNFPADSVGLVKPQLHHFDEPLTLRSGKILPAYDLMVETYGELNADKSNAILICHALSGDHNAAGFHSREDKSQAGGIAVSDQARQSILICFM